MLSMSIYIYKYMCIYVYKYFRHSHIASITTVNLRSFLYCCTNFNDSIREIYIMIYIREIYFVKKRWNLISNLTFIW